MAQRERWAEATVGNLTSRKAFLRATAAGMVFAGCGGVLCGCGPSLSENLSVRPGRARDDEPFVVRLTSLSPGERVVLSAAFDDAFGQEWSSTAVFKADGEGNVDSSKDAPVGGSYGVRDPMGLVWGALGAGNLYAPPLPTATVRLRAEVGGEETERRIERWSLAEGARAEEVREDGLVGRLFSPAGGGPAPAVLVLGGSEGGLAPYLEREAALLASRGYAALALAYFKGKIFEPDGAGDLPDTLRKVPLEYFGRALGWLGDRGGARGDRLGVLGHSRGGELALLLGTTYPEIKAVVSYVGSGALAPALDGDEILNEAAWTLGGEPLPYMWFGDWSLSGISDQELRREADEAAIPVEEIDGPVLLVAAGDDALWDSARLYRLAMDRLEQGDRAFDDELAVYPEAGHLIQAPYVPTGDSASRYGGTAEANARANEDSWKKALALLDGRLKG